MNDVGPSALVGRMRPVRAAAKRVRRAFYSVERVRCQTCQGMGGHGIVSSIGTDREFWRDCIGCDGSGTRPVEIVAVP